MAGLDAKHIDRDHLILLVDFGSTYTKLVVVDVERREVAAQAQAVTTADRDINVGFHQALSKLSTRHRIPVEKLSQRLACSSAAGGLRVVSIGLVRSLTVEAGRQAALGAGARVVGSYSDRLNESEIAEILAMRPDMILLTGGTDGGDRDVIRHNAALLAGQPLDVPVVVAGNKETTSEVAAVLREGGKEVRITENVLPRLQQINVEPARGVMRELFMEKIVAAKGLDRAEAFIGRVIMPTPAAVLEATRLLAEGTVRQAGWENIMVVDVGGATTDVHSVAKERGREEKVIRHGLPEPYAKRTVEGDLGLRVSASALLETAGLDRIRAEMGCELDDGSLETAIKQRAGNIGFIAAEECQEALDDALARICVDMGVERHVGRLREHYFPTGFRYIQDGKDLRHVSHMIGTGGIFKHSKRAGHILSGAMYDPSTPLTLKPVQPEFRVDKDYVMWSMGLLAQQFPDIALEILHRQLIKTEVPKKHDHAKSTR